MNDAAGSMLAEPDVAIETALGDIVITVQEGGPGIPAHLRARRSDPFFNTRFTTRAARTGLGLALVHTIAALHGGTFEVSPERAPPEHCGRAQLIFRIPFNPA